MRGRLFAATGRTVRVAQCRSRPTIAFESIDGPPPEGVPQADRDAERSGPATYRVRAYVSAMGDRGRTAFAWVWDVYDSDKRRALRVAGEEPGAAAAHRRDAFGRDAIGRNPWAAADEVLRRMARTGMERLAAFLSSPAERPAASPEPALPMPVAGRDHSPEAAGIFRFPGGTGPQTEEPRAPAAEAQAPPPKPSPARRRSAAARPITLDR